MKTVVALYDDVVDARTTVEDLVDAGFDRSDISLVARDIDNEYSRHLDSDDEDEDAAAEGAAVGATGGAVIGGLAGVLVGMGALAIPGIGPVVAAGPIAAGLAGAGIGAVTGGIIGALAGWGVPEEEAEYYAEGVRRGGTLVAVKVSDERADDVAEIMEDNDPVNVERRAEYWRAEQGWTGYDPEVEPYDAKQIGTYREQRAQWETDYEDDFDYDADDDYDLEEDDTIEVVEEEMRVGKREVRGGSVRVHSHVVSEPVEEDVRLRHEDVDVQRRSADRPADESDFEEKTIEMTATHEEPVVEKRARVIEEVVVRKDTDVVDETVRGTVRRTEVDVDETGDGWNGSNFEDYDQEFRRHYDDRYTTSQYNYDQYRPAYRYGHNLGSERSYQDKDWSTIEPAAKQRWEETNEGTWHEFKDAVRHAWNRAKQAVS